MTYWHHLSYFQLRLINKQFADSFASSVSRKNIQKYSFPTRFFNSFHSIFVWFVNTFFPESFRAWHINWFIFNFIICIQKNLIHFVFQFVRWVIITWKEFVQIIWKKLARWMYSGSSPTEAAVAVCGTFWTIYFCEALLLSVGLFGSFSHMESVEVSLSIGSRISQYITNPSWICREKFYLQRRLRQN